MKKSIAIVGIIAMFSGVIIAGELSIESLKNSASSIVVDFQKTQVDVPLPIGSSKDETEVVGQDLVYKFQRVKDDIWKFNTDTTWLRNDINRLEDDARRIAQGQNNPFFQFNLRDMAYKMSTYYNEISRFSGDIRNLLSLAKKDSQLNRIARDIEWDVMDINNRFQFDIQNAARDLESTIRRIDPKIIGYDAQWQAMDISRYARDISWQTQDMRWDAQKLVQNTQP